MELPELNQKQIRQRLKISWRKLKELEDSGRLRVIRFSRGTVRYYSSDLMRVEKEREKARGL